jgi:cytochrome c-type biogenesis protein
MTGLSLEELGNKEGRPLLRIFWSGLAFCLGLGVVFVSMGLTATTLGSFLYDHLPTFEVVSGVIIVIFGLHMSGILKIKMLYRTFQIQGKARDRAKEKEKRNTLATLLKPFFMGIAFAFGWTPCVGPILAAVLTIAATKERAWEGGVLLAIYTAGLAIPFVLSGLAFGTFTSQYKKFRKHLHTVEIVSGVLLVVFGLLIASHNLSVLAGWFAQIIPEPSL